MITDKNAANANILKFSANAKLNLFLKVFNRREDGYHNIVSLITRTDLADYITIEPSNELEVITEGVEQNENLAYKAALALHKVKSSLDNVLIKIDKNIPLGGGLGGGSSDAAAVLVHLTRYWDLDLSRADLIKIASDLGSDIPYFIESSSALVTGRGELVRPVSLLQRAYAVLVFPSLSVNTGSAYAKLGRRATNEVCSDVHLSSCIDLFDSSAIVATCGEQTIKLYENDFLKPFLDEYPSERALFESLLVESNGCASLSGSGATLFALFKDKNSADEVKNRLARNERCVVASLICSDNI